jgi:hypothetical protein
MLKSVLKFVVATVIGTVAVSAYASSAQAFSFRVTQGNQTLGSAMNQTGGYSDFYGLNGFQHVDFNSGLPTTGPIRYSFQNPTGSSSVRSDVWAPTAYTGEKNTSNYLAVFNGNAATINLDSAYSYFGINWGAISANNTFAFYKGNQLIRSITTDDINPLATVSASHQNNERNAYVHFYANNSREVFDRIVISQASRVGGGFESDNHSFRIGSQGFDWNDPTKTPEPATMLGLAAVGGAAWLKKRKQAA